MGFSISQFASLAGVSASTIRYYESENLLAQPERRSGRRIYYKEDIPRLNLILAARQAGFGIKEIKQILTQNKTGTDNLKDVILAAARKKTALIDQEIAHLQKQRQILINTQSCLCPELGTCAALL